MTTISWADFYEQECHMALAAIDIDYPIFLSRYGADSFELLKSKLENQGLVFRGVLGDSAVFALPSPILDDLREEIDFILEHWVFDT
jgi:hypothetical protein